MFKKKSLVFLLVGLFIISLSFVSSAGTVVTNVNTQLGYTIYYPQFDYVPQNMNFTLHIYLSNRSNSLLLLNTDVSCYLRLFNSSGLSTYDSGIMTKTLGNRHTLYITQGNFSDLGIHSWFIWCNSSILGGEASGVFEVTPTGLQPSVEKTQTINFALSFLFIISIILFVGFLFVKSAPPVKWTFFLISMMFLLQTISILFTSLQDAVINPKIVGYFDFLASASFILFWFAMGLLAVLWILTTLQTLLLKNKQTKEAKYQ